MWVIGHERAHNADHTAGIEGAFPDNDGDGISDTWEDSHYFNKALSDTTGFYRGLPMGSNDYGKGDRECLCDIQALGYLVDAHSQEKWRFDWAQGGLQWGPRPPIGTSRFPWTFRSYDPATGQPGDPQTDLPSNTPGHTPTLTSLGQLNH